MGCCCSTNSAAGVILDGLVTKHRVKSLDLEGIAKFINSGNCKKIVVMAGAGISVSAGIPDYRSIQDGLYQNKIKAFSSLPTPQHMFDLEFFLQNQAPFYKFTKELIPKNTTTPTKTHHFFNLLHKKRLLTRVYTQNVDMLERLAGIPEQYLVEVHGTMATASCAKCRRKVSERSE
tara:strand:- start:404 stop:931 length:528 start_codon:yes stop_codon:yes gene_type:complete